MPIKNILFSLLSIYMYIDKNLLSFYPGEPENI